ncbi:MULTISPECIES: GMC family oxidoreductase [unclassified Burkholderia]|uniref:GMC family oxidoreductase n=1 Tax=unclassified Burkholderia TaxID=2613784 RepID=UPI00142152AD|nr:MULTISPECIES: GMC family oxidoreductase [unclassified Burkholderia]NIE83068.1 GMC family oxidoreductase [Burkholderia sp. Tr-860]NIF61818.1 GMC family oxidoreductase [Burkholderia sp. Cy-647]NIF96942.1 GMC family oxidoreductase [Burkholderia sp. Ax-1720]
MNPTSLSADVVIVGAGAAGSVAALELASSGLSVLVLDAGPRVTRGEIVENFRNAPVTTRALTTPYPPKPWALAPTFYDTEGKVQDYLQVSGPDGEAYQTDYLRLVGGTTWHWAACAWRHLPNDFRLRSTYGVGRDWPIAYEDLEPYYYRAELIWGVCGPDPLNGPGQEYLGSPRKQKYPMDLMPWTYTSRVVDEAVRRHTQCRVVHEPEGRNTRPYAGRPTCAGNNNCMPICPIGAMYNAIETVVAAEKAGARVMENSVVYRIETNPANDEVVAVHFYNPDKQSFRVTGKRFILAAHNIETVKLMLFSKDEKNPRGISNKTDQVGRYMMEHAGTEVQFTCQNPVWMGQGPQHNAAIDTWRDGPWRTDMAASIHRVDEMNMTAQVTAAALKQGLVGKRLEQAIRHGAARRIEISSHHAVLPNPGNRLTLSDKKDMLGINFPSVHYTIDDYTRRSAVRTVKELYEPLIAGMGGTDVSYIPDANNPYQFSAEDHPVGGALMGNDPNTSVVDAQCRSHELKNLYIASSAVFVNTGTANPTLTIASLSLRVADTIKAELARA